MPGFSSSASNGTNVVFAKNADFSGSASASNLNGLQTDGQLWIGTTAVNVGNTHVNVGTITSADSSITISYSSPNITLSVTGGTSVGKTITGDIGGAISPVAGNWNIFGAVAAAATTPIRTSGSGNTLSIQVQRSQTTAATDATRIGLAAFKLADFAVDGNGFVSLSATGAGKTITGNSGGALSPTANNWNILGASAAAGTSPVTTSGAVSTLTVNVQTSQALAAADATKIGLCNFDSAAFAVSATGFVTLLGGTEAIDSIGVDATSGGGTNRVLPTAAGLVTVNGAVVAASTTPIRSVSTAANVYQIQVQTSQALAAADATKIGLSNFDSTSFAVAATGFVTLSTTGAGKTITGDSGGALSPTANNWNILGLSGSKTSGSGSTLTVKSPPFSQVGAGQTSSLNTGEFVTAAVTRTLPASAGLADGDIFIYVCTTAGALIIQSVTAQKIRVGSLISAAAGTATSTAIGDSLTLRFNGTDGFFYAVSSIGTWLVA